MRRRNSNDTIIAGIIIAAGLIYTLPELRERWPLFVAGGAAIAISAALVYIWWGRRTKNTLLGQLAFRDRMKRLTWEEFERACAALFERQGFRASLTPPTDEGVDIILRRDGRKTIVQCKHYPERHVGAPEVRELLGAKQDFGAHEAYLVTSGYFSTPARDLANRNKGLILWDGAHVSAKAAVLALKKDLEGPVAEVVDDEQVSAEPHDADQPAADPQLSRSEACPNCGKQLVMRDGRYGRFIGCTGFPKCRYTRDLDDEEQASA